MSLRTTPAISSFKADNFYSSHISKLLCKLFIPFKILTFTFLILITIAYHTELYPQNYSRELNPFSVSDEKGIIPNLFSGGINNIDFQFVDIDADDDYDIFFLDSDGTFGWYENTGTAFSASYMLSLDSISGLLFNDWFYFIDIDNDEDYDLFTSGTSTYILFLENIGTPLIPSYVIKEDTLKDDNDDPIFSEFGSNPVFADIDSDGDFDFFSGNSIGTLNFFENIGSPGNFNFKFITPQWQDIIIISGSNLEEGKITFPVKPYNLERHGASSIEFADIDDDGDLDLFWGDFFSRSLYFIENQGSASTPFMKVVSDRYPLNEDSLLTSGFNMPRMIDIDADDDLDLFISVLFDPTVPQSLIYYGNEGSQSVPDFRKITDHYLKTLDAGIQSVPVFFDIDDDGDLDLFIGSTKNPEGSIFHFENSGSRSNPTFILRDSLYAGIKKELSVSPAFGDLNGDELPDMLIGNFNGTISYYINNGTQQHPVFISNDSLRNSSNDLIDVGIYARPFLIDVDNDGDTDLISGSFNGRIALFRNDGSDITYSFSEITSYFAGIDVGDNSTPFLIDYDLDGDFDLFSGNRSGDILYFRNDGNNDVPKWNLENLSLVNEHFGGDTAPVLADLDDDSDQDIFIGNSKGGIYFFRNKSVTKLEDEILLLPADFEISVFPNPFNAAVKVKLAVFQEDYYEVKAYNIIGEKIKDIFNGSLNQGEFHFSWDVNQNSYNEVASAVLFITAKNSNSIKTIKAILLK